ncbi:hypothetical protein CCZ01_08825 [Helicobacter monodelphidis]|nr:hypothetical protein CCZ01_08825 [Helicobacter sp. 15-1451]
MGIDIASIARIKHFINRFNQKALDRFLTSNEQTLYGTQPQKVASAWAAKEAFSKALGCGICAKCGFLDIELFRNQNGQPYLVLSPRIQDSFQIRSTSISISHDYGFVIAAVIVECNKNSIFLDSRENQ